MDGMQFLSIANEDAMTICVGIRCPPTPSSIPGLLLLLSAVNTVPCLFSNFSEQSL